jgi:competence protein ComEC
VDAPTEVMARRWVFSILATGLCAWAIATPISTHVFGSMSPAGIVSNIPAVFMLTTALFFGIIKVALLYTTGDILETISTLFEIVLSKFIGMALLFGKIPFAHVSGIYTSWLWSFLTVSIVFMVTLPIKNKRRSIAITATAMATWCVVQNTNDNNTTITTINVGHGTCHIIQNGEEAIIIDAGSRNNFDIGEKKIVPELKRLGVTKIKSLAITHSDIDHICGIIDIIQELPVNKVIIAKQAALHKTNPLLMVVEELNYRGIPVLEKNSGWSEAIGSAKITMLSPHINDKHHSSNTTSIVLLLESNSRKVLFTGDIDEQIISRLSPTLPKNIDVIELPHHGQWSQEANDLIDKNKPLVVIQSTNISRHAKDTWNLPPQTTRFVTAIDGTITIIIDLGGTMVVSGSAQPDTMPPCLFHN